MIVKTRLEIIQASREVNEIVIEDFDLLISIANDKLKKEISQLQKKN